MSAAHEGSTVPNGIAPVREHSRRRTRRVIIGAALALLATLIVGFAVGDYPLSLGDLIRIAGGGGDARENYVLLQVRIPRVLMAALVGAALALAGALLQSLLRNPLASPDLLGIGGGSSVVAVTMILVFGITGPILVLGAFTGGILVAALLLAAGTRVGGRYRLILAGIGISFLSGAVISFLLIRVQVFQAQTAMLWLTGSIASTPWWQLAVVAGVIVVTIPGLIVAARALPVTQLGAATASGLGVDDRRIRLIVVVTAVLLTAATTAFVGPISFIALASPAIARALQGRGSIAVAASALVGAVLLLAADLVAQFGIPGTSLPAGIVTGALGALFLLWLLATSKGRDGL